MGPACPQSPAYPTPPLSPTASLYCLLTAPHSLQEPSPSHPTAKGSHLPFTMSVFSASSPTPPDTARGSLQQLHPIALARGAGCCGHGAAVVTGPSLALLPGRAEQGSSGSVPPSPGLPTRGTNGEEEEMTGKMEFAQDFSLSSCF